MLIINNCVCIKKGYTRAEFIRSPLYDNQDMSMFFQLDQVVDIAGLDGKFGIGFFFGRKVLKSVYLSYCGEDGIFEDDIEKTYQQQIPITEILRRSNPDAVSVVNVKDLRSYEALIIIDYQFIDFKE